MSDFRSQQEQARQYAEEAWRRYEAGALAEAIAAQRQAVLLYAAAEQAAGPEQTPSVLRLARANACQRCGDFLTEAEQFPEAANVYQEAVDLYTQLDGEPAEQEARACAQKIVANVTALRARPQERLYLLIRHYERHQQQLALEPGSEAAQAEISMRVARIFQRRERPVEALERYAEALTLYSRAPLVAETGLARAECHHRIATLLNFTLRQWTAAARHYREAIALYAAYEPAARGKQLGREMCELALGEIERLHNAECSE
jgi:tetratricopeptide (TPR) repeat protein